MAHPDREDLVGYSLGALDPGSDSQLAEHVAQCGRCERELRRLDPALGVLGESVEQLEPPGSLRQSLMATVRAEADAAAAAEAEPRRPRERPTRLRIGGFDFGPATALAVVLIVVAAIVGYGVRDAGDGSITTIAAEAPPGVTASVELEGDAATLVADGMPALPKGAVYQVWVQRDGRVEPSAMFVPRSDGAAEASVPGGEDADRIMVTRESAPGHQRPTSPPMLTVRLG